MLPLPLAAIPVTVAVLSLVQLAALLNTMVVMALPEQAVCDRGLAITKAGQVPVLVKPETQLDVKPVNAKLTRVPFLPLPLLSVKVVMAVLFALITPWLNL